MSLLNDKEQAVLDLSGDLYNAYAQLPEVHPHDRTEFIHHLHALQNIILARPAGREARACTVEITGDQLKAVLSRRANRSF